MAANTTVKVATITGAAKDDSFASTATGLTEDNTSARLNVLANDPGAARLYSLTQSTTGLSSTSQFPVVTTTTLASGATITINTDGTISYNAASIQASLQQYALGETFTDSFVYTVRMANGALSTARVTVQIAGANDAPTLAAIEPVSILDSAADDTPDAVTGVLGGADLDHGAVLRYSFADGVAFTVAEDGTLISTNDNGTIALNAQTGAYSFVANADVIDSLAEGINASAAFGVQVSDEHGATAAPVTLNFTLVGANDTAEISGETAGSVAEDGTVTAGGTLSVSDRDAGQSGFRAAEQLAGEYGDFTFDTDSGAWTYTLRNGDANVQALSGATTAYDELVITSLDGSSAETIRVSIAGADEPVVVTPPAPQPQEQPVQPINLVSTFMVNHGLSFVNDRATFYGFDANDALRYSNNFDLASIATADVDGDGVMDTVVSFEFAHGREITPVDVVLIGYSSLTSEQIAGA